MNASSQFVAWRIEMRDDAPTKVPVDAKTGRNAKSNDPSTWTTREHACAFAKARDDISGVGFVTSLEDGLVLIDLDGCCDRDLDDLHESIVEDWGQQIVDAHMGAYLRRSPSRTGLHLIVRGRLPTDSTGRGVTLPRTYEKDGKRHRQQIEVYHDRRFFTACDDFDPAGVSCDLDLATIERVVAEQCGESIVWDCRASKSGSPPPPGLSTATIDSTDLDGIAPGLAPRLHGYLEGAVLGACERLQSTPEGGRNTRLNKEAHALGRYVGAGLLHESAVRIYLAGAARSAGLGDDEIARTIESGLRAGISKPIDLDAKKRELGIGSFTRSEIRIVAGELHRVVDEAEAALVDYEDASGRQRSVFVQGDRLVQLTREGEACVVQGVALPPGRLHAARLSASNLGERFGRAAEFKRHDGRSKKLKTVDCPPNVASTYLAREGSWNQPRLAGIIATPTMRPDGSLLVEPGFDPLTRFYLDLPPRGWPVTIPDAPTREDAETAIAALREPFRKFPWELSRPDEAAFLALVLSLTARAALDRVPMFAISATTRGTGKSKLADCAARIATGEPAAMMSGSSTPEELRKAVDAILMRGASVAVIDNLERPLESPDLCRTVTAEVVDARVLGESRVVTLPSSTIWVATGNNLSVVGDLVRRTVLCKLDAQIEHPEARQFDFDPVVVVEERRHALVSAALTALRAYVVAGRPPVGLSPMGGFESWSGLVRATLVWLGVGDPCAGSRRLETLDPAREMVQQVLETWHGTLGPDPTTIAEALEGSDLLAEALEEAVGDNGGRRASAPRVGKWMQRHAGIVIAGLRLRRGNGLRRGRALWIVERV